MKPHKIMTREEYAALNLKGWHSVCLDYDNAGNIGICYGDAQQARSEGIKRELEKVSPEQWRAMAEAEGDHEIGAGRSAPNGWLPIKTCPSDGTPFLARCITTYDEYDEDDRLIGKGLKKVEVWLVQKIFGGITAIPYKASFWQNVEWTHWQPVPSTEIAPYTTNSKIGE